MPDVRTKALGYLRDGKVTVLRAVTRAEDPVPSDVVARVDGFTGRHVAHLLDRAWHCTCQTVMSTGDCAHVAAVQLVTGWPSAAAKTARARERVEA